VRVWNEKGELSGLGRFIGRRRWVSWLVGSRDICVSPRKTEKPKLK
jgi:hypothetical protein